MQLTQQRLKELLSYDPETGVFTWIAPASNRARKGMPAGHKSPAGYITIRIDRKLQMAHRLAWLYMTGTWPAQQVDHRNTRRDHNAWANLRLATHAENCRNAGISRNNTTGFKGVSKHGVSYRAECFANRKRVRKSGFASADEAATWIANTRAEMHGEFTNHGEKL